ncbi:hypothetical protein GEMRC1_010883 [Eukaryota sp. GEM-RC1]
MPKLPTILPGTSLDSIIHHFAKELAKLKSGIHVLNLQLSTQVVNVSAAGTTHSTDTVATHLPTEPSPTTSPSSNQPSSSTLPQSSSFTENTSKVHGPPSDSDTLAFVKSSQLQLQDQFTNLSAEVLDLRQKLSALSSKTKSASSGPTSGLTDDVDTSSDSLNSSFHLPTSKSF